MYMVQFTVLTNCFVENMALYEIYVGLLCQRIDIYTHTCIQKHGRTERFLESSRDKSRIIIGKSRAREKNDVARTY